MRILNKNILRHGQVIMPIGSRLVYIQREYYSKKKGARLEAAFISPAGETQRLSISVADLTDQNEQTLEPASTG